MRGIPDHLKPNKTSGHRRLYAHQVFPNGSDSDVVHSHLMRNRSRNLQSTNDECGEFIMGCKKCTRLNMGLQYFYTCQKCEPGLFLYKNSTIIGSFNAVFTACIEDCNLASVHLVNDYYTKECRSCGVNCMKCSPTDGCIICDSLEDKNLIVEEPLNALAPNLKFKVCTACDKITKFTNGFPCRKCRGTSANPTCTGTYKQYEPLVAASTYHINGSPNIANCMSDKQVGSGHECTYCKDNRGTGVINGEVQCSKQTGLGNCYRAITTCAGTSNACLQCIQCRPQSYTTPAGNITINGTKYQQVSLCGKCDDVNFSLQQQCAICNPNQKSCEQCSEGYVRYQDQMTQFTGIKYCHMTKCPARTYPRQFYPDNYQRTHAICYGCSSSCYHCFGGSSSNCLQCRYGKYTDQTTHQCRSKSSTHASFTLMVVSTNVTDLSSEDGSGAKPFSDLMRAYQYAESIAAPFQTSQVKILLQYETHYLIPKTENMELTYNQMKTVDPFNVGIEIVIRPLECGANVNGVVYDASNSKCAPTATDRVTVKNKVGSQLKFQISKRLQIKNVVFDSIDSVAWYNGDPCALTKTDCCKVDDATQIVSGISGQDCKINWSSLSCTHLTGGYTFSSKRNEYRTKGDPGHIKLEQVDFMNHFYEEMGLFNVRHQLLQVEYLGGKIERRRTCGPIVASDTPFFNAAKLTESAQPNLNQDLGKYMQRRSIRLKLAENDILYPAINIGCSTSQCTYVKFDKVTITKARYGNNHQAYMTAAYGTAFATIFDFYYYKGLVKISNCVIKDNHYYVKDKHSYATKSGSSYSPFSDSYGINTVLMRIYKPYYDVEFIGNIVENNGGFKNSPLWIYQKKNYGVIIHGNKFIRNSAMGLPSALYLTDDYYGGGISLDNNEFIENVGLDSSSKAHTVYIGQAITNQRSSSSTKTTPSGYKYKRNEVWINNTKYIRNAYEETPMVFVEEFYKVYVNNEYHEENCGSVGEDMVKKYSPFAKIMKDYANEYSWFKTHEGQESSRLMEYEDNDRVYIDGMIINGTYQYQTTPSNHRGNLLIYCDQTPSPKPYVTCELNHVQLLNMVGLTKEIVQRVTSDTIIEHDQYLEFDGGNKYRKGIVGPLFKFRYDHFDTKTKLNYLEMPKINIFDDITDTRFVPPLNIFFLIEYDKGIKHFEIQHTDIRNIDCNQCRSNLMSFENFDKQSKYQIDNVTIENWGLSTTRQPKYSVLTIQQEFLQGQTDFPWFEIKKFNCINARSTEKASCVELFPTSSQQVPDKFDITVTDSLFKNCNSKKGAFHVNKGNHNYHLVFKTSTFDSNVVNDKFGSDISAGDPSPKANLTIDGCKFYNSSSGQIRSHGASVNILYSTNVIQVFRVINSIWDCKGASYDYQKLKARKFYEAESLAATIPYSYFGFQGARGILNNVTMQNCHETVYGSMYVTSGVMVGNNLTFLNNSGRQSGGLHIVKSAIKITNYTAIGNIAYNGAGIISGGGDIDIKGGLIKQNSANEGGGLQLTMGAVTLIDGIVFMENYAEKDGSAIMMQFNQAKTHFMKNCQFINNTGDQGSIVSVTYSELDIDKATFQSNRAVRGYLGLLVMFSQVNLSNSVFEGGDIDHVNEKNIQGGHLTIMSNSITNVVKSTFKKGYAKLGGAISIDSKSMVGISLCNFTQNHAYEKGGTFYFNNFNKITMSQVNADDSETTLSFTGGSMMYASTYGDLMINDLNINYAQRTEPINAIYLRDIIFVGQAIVLKASFNNLTPTRYAESAGGIQVTAVNQFTLKNSRIEGFKNVEKGGGIAIQVIQDSQNSGFSHLIENCDIIGNEATLYGGGLFIKNLDKVFVNNTRILGNRVSGSNGNGGGIGYQSISRAQNPDIYVKDDTVIENNTVTGAGGGAYWDHYQITHLPKDMKGNTAEKYGNEIASYPHSMIIISESTYNATKKGKLIRALPTDRNLFAMTLPPSSASTFFQNQKSGGILPKIYSAMVDKRGFIVGIDSTSTGTIKVSKASEAASQYSIVLKGFTTVTAVNGIFTFQNIEFIGDPGKNISFEITSNGIQVSRPENQGALSSSSLIPIIIRTRECIAGEAFLSSGECRECLKGKEYSLVALNGIGDCKNCIKEQMICRGGSDIGPQPGWWRSSNTSFQFYSCLYPKACLGSLPPDNHPIGKCQEGFKGILCGSCEPGYSRTGEFNCRKCPVLYLNLIRFISLMLVGVIAIVFIIRSTIQGAKQLKNLQSVYIKILLNHMQLIVLTSTFDFNWPNRVLEIFKIAKPVANVSTQFLSVDCILNELKGELSKTQMTMYFQKLTIYGLLPIIMVIASVIFWKLRFCCRRNSRQLFTGRTIASIIIMMFMIHPSIVQTMFDSFNCKEVDNELRIIHQLHIICFSQEHLKWSVLISIPSIVIWGFGIPLFASGVLYKERKKLKMDVIREKYGFLYNGYKRKFFFWESVIMYRKIAIIFISVYLKQKGQITQALVVAMLLVVFMLVNTQCEPFLVKSLNSMESLSIGISMITVYCGLFYISDMPEIYNSDNDDVKVADNGLRLTEEARMALFLTILISNLAFLVFWLIKMLEEVMNTIRSKFPLIYLIFCMCGNRRRLRREQERRKIKDESDVLGEEFEKILDGVKDLYVKDKVKLNPMVIERFEKYMNPDIVMNEINYKDPELEHNEIKNETEKDTKRLKRTFIGLNQKQHEVEFQDKNKSISQLLQNQSSPYAEEDEIALTDIGTLVKTTENLKSFTDDTSMNKSTTGLGQFSETDIFDHQTPDFDQTNQKFGSHLAMGVPMNLQSRHRDRLLKKTSARMNKISYQEEEDKDHIDLDLQKAKKYVSNSNIQKQIKKNNAALDSLQNKLVQKERQIIRSKTIVKDENPLAGQTKPQRLKTIKENTGDPNISTSSFISSNDGCS